jgi:hypothetical protein
VQSKLSPADRKLLAAAGCVAIALCAAAVLTGPAPEREQSQVPSSYSSTPSGARAAYLLLERLHYPVRRWEDSPTRLAGLEEGSVLILAEPTIEPAQKEKAALSQFVHDGGRVLFCGNSIRNYVPDVRGAVVWWAKPYPLTNSGIAKQGNLEMFLKAVTADDGQPLTVYWDEYFHGERASLWSYVERTPVKWAVYQAALFTMLVLFAYSRRWGPVIPAPQVSRLSPLEFVDALGGLYQQASATEVPIGVAYRRLRLELTGKLLLPSALPAADLARQASKRLGWDGAQLSAVLDRAEAAASRAVKPAAALTLVRDLETFTNRLDPQKSQSEKN